MKRQKNDYVWLAEKFEVLRTTQKDGTPAFNMSHGRYRLEDLMSILETYEEFEPGISDVQRQRLIRDAIFSAGKAGQITATSLMRELSAKKTSYRKQPKSDYVLLTSLSMKRPAQLHRLAFDAASFTFSDALPTTFSRKAIKFHATVRPPKDFPAQFAKVRVKVEARSVADAFETALISLDYLRGIWNFIINSRFSWRWNMGPAKPVNSIFLGPVHTLHHSSGELAHDIYWYEPAYPPEGKAEEVKDWPAVSKKTGDIRKLIGRHPYQSFVRESFVRYARSLDGIDHESSFLKFWSLLEWLTAISEEQNYSEVIKRAVFLFEDEDYHRRILEHLRLRRNSSVHKGQSITHADRLIFQIKAHVEWLIRSHLVSCGRYDSPQQYGQMLSSPRDSNEMKKLVDELGRRMKLLKNAQKIWEPKNKADTPDK